MEEMMGKLQKDERLRRTYMAYLDDGILDIFAGFVILFAGLTLFTDMFWMAGAYVAIFLPTVWAIKEKVTMPRVRREELRPQAARRTSLILPKLIAVLLLVLVLGVLVFLIFNDSALMPALREMVLLGSAGLVAVTVLGGFMFVAHVHRAPRWYAYAALAVLFATLAWWLTIGLPWVLIATGTVMAMTSIVHLWRFLRHHPILPEAERPSW